MQASTLYSKQIQLNYENTSAYEGDFHSHYRYEIYYFHGGKCNYLIGDKIYILSPGDLIIMNGMTLHCANVGPDLEYCRSIIHFEPSFLSPWLEIPGAINVLKPFQDLRNVRLQLRGEHKLELERLLQLMNSYKGSQHAVHSNRYQLTFVDMLYYIYQLCEKPLESQQDLSTDKEKHVQNVISFVEAHYIEDIHLQRLEEELHLSKYYLSKIFKEVTGATIFEYLYQLRINQAKILFLLHKEISVTEACYQVGFKHLAHFSRMFKRQVGDTPERYRKMIHS